MYNAKIIGSLAYKCYTRMGVTNGDKPLGYNSVKCFIARALEFRLQTKIFPFNINQNLTPSLRYNQGILTEGKIQYS